MIVLVDARTRSRRDTMLLGAVSNHLQEAIRAAEPSRVIYLVHEDTPIELPANTERLSIAPGSADALSIFLDGPTRGEHVLDDVLCLAPLAGPLRSQTVAGALSVHAEYVEPTAIVRVRRLPSREHPAFLQPLPLAAMDNGKLVTHARLKPWSLVIAEGGVDADLAALLPFESSLEGAGSQYLPRLPYADGSLELIPKTLITEKRYRDPERRRYVEIGPHEGEGLEALLYETA